MASDPLEDLSRVLALRNLAESSAARAGWVLELELPEDTIELPPDIEQGIYRVAQEALENAAKHSQARQVHVQLTKPNDLLTPTVADDGKGFDQMDSTHHFGLKDMHERAALMGGTLEVISRPGQGTSIRLMEAWRDSSFAV